MSRISLEEAYNNRDVIAWLVRNSKAIDELQNILRDIDPNGDLTNVVTKTGDQVIDGNKTFIGQITADCDIIQNGGAYETHAEQVYSHNDYMIMRDGALNGLAAGQYSGLQVQKYDGATNARMCLDNTGVMRVGDINDEQPIATRDEAGSMTDSALVVWDAANQKITAPAANIGDDNHPIKIVGGEPVQAGRVPFTTEIRGSNYASYADLYAALLAEGLVEGNRICFWRYYDTSGGNFIVLSGTVTNLNTTPASGTYYYNSSQYLIGRIQVVSGSLKSYVLTSGFTETAFDLNYQNLRVIY